MNMKKLIAMLIVGLMLLSLVPLAFADDGNETSEDECVEDTDCDEGEFCDSGECEDVEEEAECVEDTDCENGYFCDEDECKEVEEEEEAECVEDTDCEEGYFCDSGECEEIDEDFCVEDSDCAEGYFCDEDECEDIEEAEEEADEDDVKVFKIPHGAEVRLIQLERSIDRNIAHGERIVEAILANDENASVDALTGILEDMGDLIDEIQGMDLENKTPEELAEQYVEIKSRARDFSKQFKDAARGFFTEGEAKALREILKEMKSGKHEEYKAKFEKARNVFNAESLRALLEKLGIEDDMIDEVIAEADFEQVKGKIVQKFKDLTKEAKVTAVKTVREDKAKNAVFGQATVTAVKQRIALKLKEHADEEGRPEAVKQRLRVHTVVEDDD